MGSCPEGAAVKGLPSSSTTVASETWYMPLYFICTYEQFLTTLGFSGVFDPKPDLSAFQSNSYSSSPSDTNGSTTVAAPGAPFPNPKLGMAPLSSELGYSGFPGRPSGSGEAGTES